MIDYDKLKAIEKPFGLLDESVQFELARAFNMNHYAGQQVEESNIVMYCGEPRRWQKTTPPLYSDNTYRLDPAWQPPEEKEPECPCTECGAECRHTLPLDPDTSMSPICDNCWAKSQPEPEKPKRRVVVVNVEQPHTADYGHLYHGLVHFHMPHSRPSRMQRTEGTPFSQRECIAGYAGVMWEGREGAFSLEAPPFINTCGAPEYGEARRNAIENGELRPAKPLKVAFIVEDK